MEISPKLSAKIAQLPTSPGVYLMKDSRGSVIYVGKAKSLRSRVRFYFQRLQDLSHKTRLMVSKITDLETIVTKTEKDALILENSLIKKSLPRFNVQFRDDKEHPYLKLSIKEPYPNLTIIRKPQKDGSMYFGPFASAQAVRETVKVIHKIFPLRKCSGKKLKKDRPCVYYQLGQCPAPCCCQVPPEQYNRTVKDVQLFLQGRGSDIIAGLKKSMQHESDKLNYELAARIRDRITAIEKTLERQSVVCLDFADRDVFSFYREGSHMGITVLFVRSGRMTGSRNFFLKNLQLTDEEVISSFIAQYYHQGEFIPREILTPLPLEDKVLLEDWLREKKEQRVIITFSQRGAKKNLVQMAAQNARIMFDRTQAKEKDTEAILQELQKRLHLKNYPARIACCDISNIMGTSAVGSLVMFEDGRPFKPGYRRYRIKTVHQPNDYAMMYEVLGRFLAPQKRETHRPDLIMVDGGKGQLGVLIAALREHGHSGIDAIALAKAQKSEKSAKKAEEKVFLPHRKNPVLFPGNSQAFFLLQRVRDEAHRFAISYHKHLKKKNDFTSPLESIAGIGVRTAHAVLKHFGSLDKAREATLAQIQEVPTVTLKRAEMLYRFFHPEQQI